MIHKGGRSHHQSPFAKYLSEVIAETDAVNAFVSFADEIGFEVPDAHLALSGLQMIENLASGGGGWPDIELSSPFGIAQHHGIPTRLLDWSRKPLVSAFFACKLSRNPEKGQRLVVWSIDKEYVDNMPATYGLYSIEASRAQDAYLREQGGLFLAFRDAGLYRWNFVAIHELSPR